MGVAQWRWAWRLALPLALAGPGCAVAEWRLQRDEDFARGVPPDPAFWMLESGFQRNQEKQYYTAHNLSVDSGYLRLEARREKVPNAAWQAGSRAWQSSTKTARYTSASLVARQALRYGRIEVVARSPSGAGAWPAIWLVHEGRGVYGEIDIFEAVGKHPDTVFAGIHYGREPRTRRHRSASRVVPGFEGSWHTHTLEWTPQRIAVAVDGQVLLEANPDEGKTRDIDPLRQPMVLRINLALGGTWGGPIDDAKLPVSFDIRSIRIWQWDPSAAASPNDGPVPPLPASSTAETPGPAALRERSAGMRWGR